MSRPVLSEVRGAVGVLTLNNPDRLNALSHGVIPGLIDGLATFEADPAVRAVVLTGAGRGFCAGADLSGGGLVSAGDGMVERIRGGINRLIAAMRASPLPIVVAVNGPAAGAGVGIALAGDFVLAALSAKFVLSFVRIGLALDAGASVLLPRLVGPVQARRLAMLGEPVGAAEAERIGLIHRAVDDPDLMPEAIDLAGRLAAGPPLSLARIKRELEHGGTATLADALDLEAALQGEAAASEDLREGVAAFAARRPPVFAGR